MYKVKSYLWDTDKRKELIVLPKFINEEFLHDAYKYLDLVNRGKYKEAIKIAFSLLHEIRAERYYQSKLY